MGSRPKRGKALLAQNIRQARRLRYFYPSNKGDMIAGWWRFVSADGDSAARLDAIATLVTLPQRLVEIGYKRLNGERLSEADDGG